LDLGTIGQDLGTAFCFHDVLDPSFCSAGKATWVSLWAKQNFAERPNEPVSLISGDLAQKPKFRRLTQAPYKATSEFRFSASVLKLKFV
jgi:hypothetical protein